MPKILITENDERAQARWEQTQKRIESRAYQLYEAEGAVHGHALDHWLEAEYELTRPARTELLEADDGKLVVQVELAGFDGGVELNFSCGGVVLYAGNGEDHPRGRVLLDERGGQVVCKHIPLPLDVDPGKATARLSHGLLTVRIPRSRPLRP